MDSIVIGVLLGALVGVLLCAIVLAIEDCLVYNPKVSKVLLNVAVPMILIVSTVVGGAIGTNVGKHFNASYIEQYKVTKQVIEESVTNSELSGLERVELVKQAVEENQKLVSKQYDSQQWYGFTIPDEIVELTLINLTLVDANG